MDLRKLMMKIKEQKQMEANLSLEFDCELDTEDPKPLIKVINYLINFLTPLTDRPLEIQLNAQTSGYLLSFSVFTEAAEFPELSTQVIEILKEYNARIEIKNQAGKYYQAIIIFE